MHKCLTVAPHRQHYYFINKFEYDLMLERKNERYHDDRKLFILIHYVNNKKVYTAIDNITGDYYVEDFTSLNDALIWLTDLKTSEPLQKAEEQEWWW